jgi:hypothetical protein
VTTVLPVPVPLPDPPGSAAGLVSAVGQLTVAASSAGLLCHLLEPAAVLRGWRSADATVAGAEVTVATEVAAGLHGAVTVALARLQAHGEAWLLVERRLAVLRQRQAEQFAAAGHRLATLAGPLAALTGGPAPPGADALVAEVVADEAARAAEHRALLTDLAEDAHRSAAVLAAAAAPLGGAGRPGEAPRVAVRLAAVLPGWGTRAMTGLGLEAAADLTARGDLAAVSAAALRYAPYAGVPAFAEALARGLGREGTTYLLAVLGAGAGTDAGQDLADLLARTLRGDGPAGALLDAQDPDGGADVVAVGMGVVLAAPGAGAGLAASWGRAVLERERAQGASAVDRTTSTLPDPVDAALRVLVRAGDAAAAADLLRSPAAWGAALARDWSDGGAALAAVIDLGACAPGGARSARAGLEAFGQGLAPGSDTAAIDVRRLLPAVRDALGGLVAAQADAVAAALVPVAAGAHLDVAADAGLRGLGLLLSEPGPDALVTGALVAALRDGGVRVAAGAGAGEVASGEVAGAYVAVQEYGQRVRHALACARELTDAVDRQLNWTIWVTLPSLAVRGPSGELVAGLEDVAARAFRADGTVVPPRDTGLVRTADDAARLAGAVLVGGETAGRAGFRRTTAALGVPEMPDATSPLDVLDDLDPPDRRPGRRGKQARPGR